MKKSTPAVIAAIPKSLLSLSIALAPHAMAADNRLLEEIVVTAEHREASLQDTPISMSAFSSEAIEDLGISSGLDLFGHTPNMNVQEFQGGRSGLSYSIRGVVNAEVLITFDPGVSVYMDNVLIAKNVGSHLDVAELERIEVLRGPQGTLYGRNTMGGAVNYITRKPVDEWEGRVSATVGNYETYNLRGMLNVPLLGSDSDAGELNLRVSAALLNQDEGIYKNEYVAPPGQPSPPDELGTVDRETALVQLQWQPSDSLSVLYAYDYTQIDEIPKVPFVTRNSPAFPPGADIESSESDIPEKGAWDAPLNVSELDVDGHGLNIHWDLSDSLQLQSITGYREMESFGAADADGSANPFFFSATFDKQKLESLSQEFRLLGSSGDSKLDYSFGLYYWDEEGELFNAVNFFGFNAGSDSIAEYENEAWAIYGQATFHFSDRLDITAGWRYTEEEREMRKANIGGMQLFTPVFYDEYIDRPGVGATIFPEADTESDNFSWLLSLAYDWTDDMMTYFKISTGYQSGGINIRSTTPAAFIVPFDEETVTAYEIGIKSEWSERVIVNAAVFYSDYKDRQINVFNPFTLGSVRINEDVETYGGEIEVIAHLNEYWRAGFGWGYLHQDFKDSVELDFLATSDSGINFTYAPENTGNAHIAYEHPLDMGIFSARLDWSYRDEMFFLALNPEPNSSGDFSLWNARVSLDEIKGPGDTSMRVSLWGKNLTDQGYWTSGVHLPGVLLYNLWGQPRTYGVDFEVRF